MKQATKVLTCGIALSALLSQAQCLAANIEEECGFVNERTVISISGEWEEAKGRPVIIFVETAENTPEVIWSDQKLVRDDGKVNFTFAVKPGLPSGKYEYKLASKGTTGISGTLEAADYEEYDLAWKKVSEAKTISDTAAAISEINPCLNLSAFEEIEKSELYTHVYNKRRSVTDADSLYRILRKGTLLAAINQKTASSGAGNSLNGLSELGVSDVMLKIYNEEFSSKFRTAVNELAAANQSKNEEIFIEYFEKLVMTNRIMSSNDDISKALQYFREYAQQLELDLSKLPSKYETEIVRNLLKRGAQTPEKLKSDYEDVCSELKNPSPPGGGGGSGGYTAVAVPKDVTTEKTQYNVFSDMEGFSWAKEAVFSLRDMGVVNGKTATLFDPASNVTREEFLKMLLTALELNNANATIENVFTDVSPEQWYGSYVASGSALGIANGISENEFGTGHSITRQDMAVMSFRALKYVYDAFGEFAENDFSDRESISEYAISAVNYMKKLGVINGYPDGGFKPMQTASRAEAAQIIYRIIELKKAT